MATSQITDLEPGEQAQIDPPFTFALHPGVANGAPLDFTLTIEAAGGYSHQQAFSLVAGDVPVLIVDDNEGDQVETYVARALEDSGYAYRIGIRVCAETMSKRPLRTSPPIGATA